MFGISEFLIVSAATFAVVGLFALLGSVRRYGKAKTKLEAKGLLGLAIDQLFGPKNPKSPQEVIRDHCAQKVDLITGEVLSKPRKVIIGWIDSQTGEITPNPQASQIAKEKGVLK